MNVTGVTGSLLGCSLVLMDSKGLAITDRCVCVEDASSAWKRPTCELCELVVALWSDGDYGVPVGEQRVNSGWLLVCGVCGVHSGERP